MEYHTGIDLGRQMGRTIVGNDLQVSEGSLDKSIMDAHTLNLLVDHGRALHMVVSDMYAALHLISGGVSSSHIRGIQLYRCRSLPATSYQTPLNRLQII